MADTNFYTMGPLLTTIVTGGNQTTGTADRGNLVDCNLNTSCGWLATGGSHFIFYDLCPQDEDAYAAGRGVASGSYESVAMHIQNYTTDFSSCFATVRNSYYAETATSYHIVCDSGTYLEHEGGPLFFFDCNLLPIDRRFVRMDFAGMDGVGETLYLSLLSPCKKRTVSTTPEYSLKINPEYYTDIVKMTGGREYRSLQALNCTYSFDQKFTFIAPGNKNSLTNAFHDCRGEALPLIYQPYGAAVNESYLCYFNEEEPDIEEIDHQYYQAKVKFKTLPYIKDGENY